MPYRETFTIVYPSHMARTRQSDADILQTDLTSLEKWEKNTGEWNSSHLNVVAFPLRVSGTPPPYILTSSDLTRKIIISKIFRSHSVGKALMVRTRNKNCKQSKSCPRNDQKKYNSSQVTSLPDNNMYVHILNSVAL